MKRSGFTLVELLISISILTLISAATVFSLRGTRQNEELHTAARLLAGDVRNVQARALAARNVLTCDTVGGTRVCEQENPSAEACISPCVQEPPPKFGLSIAAGASAYELFADVDVSEWRRTSDREILLQRILNPFGSDTIRVDAISTELGATASGEIAVERQNGQMRINACGEPGQPACAPSEPQSMTIRLRHQDTGKTADVEVNAITGRVSVQ
ncbi:type II secretion system protein [Candidatus Uhrbacteria bacterium]|nr:type II secretion system protein [Candidatus Uhrbacteria bacterium]